MARALDARGRIPSRLTLTRRPSRLVVHPSHRKPKPAKIRDGIGSQEFTHRCTIATLRKIRNSARSRPRRPCVFIAETATEVICVTILEILIVVACCARATAIAASDCYGRLSIWLKRSRERLLARMRAETSATATPLPRQTLASALRSQSAPGTTLQLTLNDGTTRIIHYPVLLSEDVVEFPSGAKLRDRTKISWSEIASIKTSQALCKSPALQP
jgi:hypothetical protein